MTELRFDGRTALITGSGRGLGRAHALLLGARGANVVVNDPGVGLSGNGGDQGPAQEVADEITAAGGKAVANFDSVATPEGAVAMVGQAIKMFGRIDIVVNNAGTFLPEHSFEESTVEGFESLWRVHVLGTINVIHASWPHMKAQKYGRIINTGSHVGYLGVRNNVEYAAAKGAIHGLTRTLSMESTQHGITVNLLAPAGLARSNIGMQGVAGGFPVDAFAAELVAPALVWLAHEDCDVNGDMFATMSGTTTQIRVAETNGYFDKTPTPEAIRDNFDRIQDLSAINNADLVFGTDGITHGGRFVAAYQRAD